MRCACDMRVQCVRCTCDMRVQCVRCACDMRVQCVRCACDMRVTSPPDRVPDGSNTSPAKDTDRTDTCLSNVTYAGGGTINGRFRGPRKQTFFAF